MFRTLANSFPPCGISVVSATDSMIYKSDVYSASSLSSSGWFDEESGSGTTSKRSSSERGRVWGDKAVLVLVGLRLGLDGVNPIYYDSIKVSSSVPHSGQADRSGIVHFPPIGRYCRWETFFIILLYRYSRRLTLLPRSAFHEARRTSQNSSCTHYQITA